MLTGLWERLWRPHIELKTEPKFTNTKNHEHLQFLKSILSESTHKTLMGLLNNVFVKCKEKTLLENNCWLTLLIWDHLFISCVANDSKLQHKKYPSKIVFSFRMAVKPFIKYLKITQRNTKKIFPLKPTSARSFVKLSVNECFWTRSNLWLRTNVNF